MDIPSYRKKHDLSQAGFAALFQNPPASQSLISQWEAGEQPITAERAVQIEEVTGGAVTRGELRPDLWACPEAVR